VTHAAFVRIDDRLIHGQVVVKWLRYLGCKEILIVDDALCHDDFMQNVLRLAAPPGVRVRVAAVHEAARLLRSAISCRRFTDTEDRHSLGESKTPHPSGWMMSPDLSRKDLSSTCSVLVLVRSPQTVLALLDNGFSFDKLNVGGLAAGEGTTRLYKSISANSEQIAALHAIRGRGVRVYFQMVPEERPVEMSDLLPIRQSQQESPLN